MPRYKVWYRETAEILEFDSEQQLSDSQILDKILDHEHIAGYVLSDQYRGTPQSSSPPTVGFLIEVNKLAPVRYRIDHGDETTIG